MVTQTQTPGVVYPELKQYPAGAHSPRTAAIANQNASVAKQSSLLETSNGGGSRSRKRRKRRKSRKSRIRYGGAVAVPQFQMMYTEPGAGGQTVNGNIVGTTQLGASSAASSSFDACIGKGASCTAQVESSQKGGVKWGCYSGGKYKRKTKVRRTKKNKRKQRTSSRTRIRTRTRTRKM